MERRTVLQMAVAASPFLLAGCLDGGGARGSSPLWSARLEIVPLSVGGVAAWIINGEYTVPGEQVGYSELAGAVESGTATEVSPAPPSPQDGLSVAPPSSQDGLVSGYDSTTVHEGVVYEIRSKRVEQNVGADYKLRLADPSTAPDVPTVPFRELPTVDKTHVTALPWDRPLGVATTVTYMGDERAESRLVGADRGLLIQRDGQRGYVVLEDPQPYHRYKITAVEVASAERVGRQFVDRFAVHLDDLSDAEQRAFDRGLAVAEGDYGYLAYQDETPIPGYQGLLEKLRPGEPVRRIQTTGKNGRTGMTYVYLVERDQNLYRVDILDP